MTNKAIEEQQPRYCKKCGAEIPSTGKSKLCINCRRRRGETIRNAVLATCTLIGSFFIGNHVINKPSGDSTTNVDKEDDSEQA